MNSHRANLEWMLNKGSLFSHPSLVDSSWWQRWQGVNLAQVDKALTISRQALGHAYESYWQALLTQHPGFQMRYANQQIFQQKRTIGELDLIVENSEGRLEHWELACKFYMLVSDQMSNPYHWLGPNTRDSLGTKMQRLLQQQLSLTQTPECTNWLASEGVDATTVQAKGIVQGRLFLPTKMALPQTIRFELTSDACFGVSAEHLGYWGEIQQLTTEPFKRCSWQLLQKIEWLSAVTAEPSPISSSALAEIVAQRQSPVMCRMLESQQVYFWVPQSWLDQANSRIYTDENKSPKTT